MKDNVVDGIIISNAHTKVYQVLQEKRTDPDYAPQTTLQKLQDTLTITIEAKDMLHRRMLGELDDKEFAYALAKDDQLRKTTNNLVQQIIQPTPVETIHGRPNQFIDLAAGVSTFWQEVNKDIPLKVDNAVEVENIIMNIEAGLDISIEPSTRKAFLAEAGIGGDKLGEFVTIKDYITYENNIKDSIRLQVMEEMGMSSEELSENDELLIDSLTEDRMFNQKIYVDDETSHEPTYEDIYGLSAQDMYEMFNQTEVDKEDIPAHTVNVSVDDEEWIHLLDMCGAEDRYYDMMNASVEENMEVLQNVTKQVELEIPDDMLNFTDQLVQ